ncbi:MAG: hypothetical protein IJ829_02505 [Kiritimatiellae bacterium]|nr:hypothetical protein [Kiritimatiellia bacterium]
MKHLKFGIAALAVAAVATAFAAENAADEEDVSGRGAGAIGMTPIQIGLFAPVSLPWGLDWDLKGFDLDLFYTETVKFEGLGISGIATRTRDDMAGVLVSGLCNWHEADARGIDLTVGANIARGDVYGVDIGSFGMRNMMKGVDVNLLASYQKEFVGWQTAIVCNFSEGDCTGASFALGFNMARVETGLQVAAINCADELHGVQIGLFNLATECPNGLQIGFLNIIMDNRVKVLPILNCYFGGGKE